MLKHIIKNLRCIVGKHDWTCAENEGFKASPIQKMHGFDGFWNHPSAYCRECGKVDRDPKGHASEG